MPGVRLSGCFAATPARSRCPDAHPGWSEAWPRRERTTRLRRRPPVRLLQPHTARVWRGCVIDGDLGRRAGRAGFGRPIEAAAMDRWPKVARPTRRADRLRVTQQGREL